MTIFERIKEERKKLGLTQPEMGEIGGVQKKAQLNYEKGERSPDASYLAAIAVAGADVQYILTGIRSGSALPDDEEELLGDYRSMDAIGKKAIKALCKVYSKRQASVSDTAAAHGKAVVQRVDTNTGAMVGVGNIVGNTTIHGIGAENGKPKRRSKS